MAKRTRSQLLDPIVFGRSRTWPYINNQQPTRLNGSFHRIRRRIVVSYLMKHRVVTFTGGLTGTSESTGVSQGVTRSDRICM